MAVDPDERPQSAGDLARELRAALEGQSMPVAVGSVATGDAAPVLAALGPTIHAPPAQAPLPAGAFGSVQPPDGPPPRRSARIAAVAALVVALLGGGTLLGLSGRSTEGEPPNPTAPEAAEPTPLSVEDSTATVTEGSAVIQGRTTPGARVEVAGRPATVEGDRFSRRVELEVGTNRILVVASGAGLRTTRREIVVERAQPVPPVQEVEEPVPPEGESRAEADQDGGPDREALADACNDGDNFACDQLYDVGARSEEQFDTAVSCGGQGNPEAAGRGGDEGECLLYYEGPTGSDSPPLGIE